MVQIGWAKVGDVKSAANGFGQVDLPCGRTSDVFTANDVGDALLYIIYGGSKLVGVATFPVQ